MQESLQQLEKASSSLSEKCQNRDCLREKMAYKSNFLDVKRHSNDTSALISDEVKCWQTELEEKNAQLTEMRRKIEQLTAQNAELLKQNAELTEAEQELRENHRLLVDEHKNCAGEIQRTSGDGPGLPPSPPQQSTPTRALDSEGAKILKKIVVQLGLDNPLLGLGVEQKMRVLRALFERLAYAFPEGRAAELISNSRTNSGEVHVTNMRELEQKIKQVEQMAAEECTRCGQLKKELAEEKAQRLNTLKESFEVKRTKCNLENQLKQQRQQIDDLVGDNDKLSAENLGFRARLDQYRDNDASLEQTIQRIAMERQLEQLTNQNVALVQEREMRDAELQSKDAELLKEEAKSSKAAVMMKQAQKDRDDLRNDLQQMETERDEFRTQKADLLKDMTELEEQNKQMAIDKAKLAIDMSNLEEAKVKLEAHNSALKADKTKLETEIANCLIEETRQSELIQENALLHDQLVDFKEKLDKSEAKLVEHAERTRQLLHKLKEKGDKKKNNSLLQYENDAKQRINDIVEKKRAMDQALLFVSQAHQRMEQWMIESQRASSPLPVLITVPPPPQPSTSNNSGVVPRGTVANAANFAGVGSSANSGGSSAAGSVMTAAQCLQCPILQRQLENERRSNHRLATDLFDTKKLADDLSGAVALLLGDPATRAGAAAHIQATEGTSQSGGSSVAKRPRPAE